MVYIINLTKTLEKGLMYLLETVFINSRMAYKTNLDEIRNRIINLHGTLN
jgi:hypothetical protein